MPTSRQRKPFAMGGWRIARISGIDIRLDFSLIAIFSLIVLSLGGGVFPSWHPEWGPGSIWLTAFSAAVLFFASILVHELAHALVGRRLGVRIDSITLFIFGGVAQLEQEPRSWRAELWMAVAGPVASLLIGVLCLLLANLTSGPVTIDPANPYQGLSRLGPLASLLVWLGPVNIIIALFNLVPGFPLDGGRALRAVLWGFTRDLRQATRMASRLGQVFAWVLILTGFAMMLGHRVPIFGTGVISGLWLAFIGWFLNNAALMSYRQLIVREALEHVPVRRLMQTGMRTVGPDLRLDALIHDYLMQSSQRVFPVVRDDELLGLVCLQDIRRVPREGWSHAWVAEVMMPLEELTTIAPDEDATEALSRLSRHGVNQLPVVEGGRIRGLISREDILKWLSLYGGHSE